MRKLIVAAAAASLIASAGCGGSRGTSVAATPAPPFYRPVVQLREVKLAGVGITGGALEILLNVYNPNAYDLDSPRVAYRVLVDDNRLATGLTDLDIVVPAGDSMQVRLPASFSYVSLGRVGRSVMNAGAANYRVLGDMTVGTPYGRFTFPYDRAGMFSPMQSVGGIR